MLSLSSIRFVLAASVALVVAAPLAVRATTIYSNDFSSQGAGYGDPAGFQGVNFAGNADSWGNFNNQTVNNLFFSPANNAEQVTVYPSGNGLDTFGEETTSGTVPGTYQANTVYTFSAVVSTTNSSHNPTAILAFIDDNSGTQDGSNFVVTNAFAPNQNGLLPAQVTLDTSIYTGLVGHAIGIAYAVSNTVGSNQSEVDGQFDNFLVTASPIVVTPPSVPEPASVSLIAIGATALLARRRHA